MKKNYLYLSIAILAITYFSAVFFMYKYGGVYIDSDMSAEMISAELLNKERRIITPNWYYSTEIYIAQSVQILRLGLLLFPGNWHAARVFSVAVLLAMLALSYIYVGRKTGSLQASILVAAGLMCPFGYWYMFHGVFDNFYIAHMIKILLAVGLLLDLQNKKNKVFPLLGYILLCTLGGAEGVRMLMNLTAPLLAATSFLVFYYFSRKKEREDIMYAIRMFLWAFLGAVMYLIGYKINRILAQNYHFVNYGDMTWKEPDPVAMIKKLTGFLTLFGYPEDGFIWDVAGYVTVFDKYSILVVSGILIAGVLVFAVIMLLKRIHLLNPEQQFIIIFLLASLIVDSFIYTSVGEQMNNYYWLPFVPIAFMILQIEMETETFQYAFSRRIIVTGLVITILVSSILTSKRFLEYPPRAHLELAEIANLLTENGYQKGYATFWNSDVMTELSDGQLEMYTIVNFQQMEIYQWLQKISHNIPPEGEVFLLMSKKEMSRVFFDENASLIYEDDAYLAYACDDVKELIDKLKEDSENEG